MSKVLFSGLRDVQNSVEDLQVALRKLSKSRLHDKKLCQDKIEETVGKLNRLQEQMDVDCDKIVSAINDYIESTKGALEAVADGLLDLSEQFDHHPSQAQSPTPAQEAAE